MLKSQKPKDPEIISGSIQLSIRFKNVLFPFNQIVFLGAIEKIGFVPIQKIPPPPAQRGVRFAIGGEVAVKGNIYLSMVDEKQVLSLRGVDPNALAVELNNIENLILEEFAFDSEKNAFFYEFLGNLTYKASDDPINSFKNISEKFAFLEKLARISGRKLGLFGLRLVDPSAIPNQIDWYEFNIEPDLNHSRQWYSINTVFRNGKKSEVESFCKKFFEISNDFIKELGNH